MNTWMQIIQKSKTNMASFKENPRGFLELYTTDGRTLNSMLKMIDHVVKLDPYVVKNGYVFKLDIVDSCLMKKAKYLPIRIGENTPEMEVFFDKMFKGIKFS